MIFPGVTRPALRGAYYFKQERMIRLKKTDFRTGAALALLAALFTVAVSVIDVDAIGPAGTLVGFSHLNAAAHEALGVHMALYKLTQILGVAALGLAALFALMGLLQLIRRKSLWKVDREILALGCLYVAVLALYVLFEKAVVNYRPVIMPGELAPEASFPSSHTMLACTVLGSAAILCGKYVRDGRLARLLRTLCVVVLAVIVCGRLLSGVHWLTDIIGGILYSAALLFLFYAAVRAMESAEA